MSVPAGPTIISYATVGATIFPFPYLFEENNDLMVSLFNTSTYQSTPLVLNTDYTVTGATMTAGGTVTLVVALQTGYQLFIERRMPLSQASTYSPIGAIDTVQLNTDLDRLVMISQQLYYEAQRSIRNPVWDSTAVPTLDMHLPVAAVRAGTILGFDPYGQPLCYPVNTGTYDQFDGPQYCPTDTGTANAYIVLVPNLVLGSGRRFSAKLTHANTGASTITLNGAGPYSIIFNGAVLSSGVIIAGGIYEFLWDGTNINLLNPSVVSGGGGTVPNSQLAAMAASTIKGNATGSSSTPQDISVPGNGPVYDATLGLVDSMAYNAQTGTSYTIANTDRSKLVTFNSGSAVAVTLPDPSVSSNHITSGFYLFTLNIGSANVTITCAGSGTVNGIASLTLTPGQGFLISCVGSTYLASFFSQTAPSSGSTSAKFSNVVTFTSGSGATWTVPATITLLEVEMVGGGGAGGSTFSSGGGGSGGGGGGYAKFYVPVTPGGTLTYTVGTGGSAPSSGTVNANAGTTTSVTYGATTVAASGGSGGIRGNSTSATGGVAGSSSITSPWMGVAFSGRQGSTGLGSSLNYYDSRGGDSVLGMSAPPGSGTANGYGAGGPGAVLTLNQGGTSGGSGIIIIRY